MATTPLERLTSDIQKILTEYADEVSDNVDSITRQMGQKGAKALRASSKASFGGTGKYASGWTYRTEKTRFGNTTTIYNRTPGLPHLLENGHAKRGGGRVAGRSHIAPVESELTQTFETEVRLKL